MEVSTLDSDWKRTMTDPILTDEEIRELYEDHEKIINSSGGLYYGIDNNVANDFARDIKRLVIEKMEENKAALCFAVPNTTCTECGELMVECQIPCEEPTTMKKSLLKGHYCLKCNYMLTSTVFEKMEEKR